MNNDYRNTQFCPKLECISVKKDNLKQKILKNHPKVKIIYNKVKIMDSDYRKEFMEIYNNKCSYCGNSIQNISVILLEIDHYICESSFNSNEESGRIENLVLACYECNRPKKNFLITGKYIDILNPDFETIKEVFYRDDLYYIKIADKYLDDQFIVQFYNNLRLNYETRRLDYLLMSMRSLAKKLDGTPKGDKLNTAVVKLQEKRNSMISKQDNSYGINIELNMVLASNI